MRIPRLPGPPALRSLVLALLALFGAACIGLDNRPGVVVSTYPPGARVIVDGVDSGFVTPCNLGISKSRHQLDLLLEGYRATSVQIKSDGRMDLIYWREGYVSSQTWHFPLFLNYEDGFAPIKYQRTYAPARVHVPMRLAEEP